MSRFDRPVILEARTHPNVPPLPPHIAIKDAQNVLSMMPKAPEDTRQLEPTTL